MPGEVAVEQTASSVIMHRLLKSPNGAIAVFAPQYCKTQLTKLNGTALSLSAPVLAKKGGPKLQ